MKAASKMIQAKLSKNHFTGFAPLKVDMFNSAVYGFDLAHFLKPLSQVDSTV